MAKKTKPDTIKQVYTVDPHVSALSLLGIAPEGYEAVRIDRKNTKATVTYQRKRKK